MQYKKNTSSAVALGLAMVIGLSPAVFANKELEDAKAERTKIQNNLNATQNKIDNTRSEVNSVSAQLAELDRKVNLATAELEQVNGEISRLEGEIAQVKKDLDEAKSNLAEKQDTFATRLRVMYTNGSVGYLEVLLNSKDVESLLTNTDMLNAIAKQDRDLIEYIKEQIETIHEKEKVLKDKQQELEGKRSEVEQKKSALESATAEKTAYMNNLEGNLSEYESEYDEMLRESDEIEKKIAGIQTELAAQERARKAAEEAARQREAEARRQQEAARQKKSSSSVKKSTSKRTASAPVKELPMTSEPAVRSNKSMTWPVPGHTRISSPYGYRIHPVLGYKKFHTGVDIPAPVGTPVVAAKDGVVITATFMNSYGNVVMINHGDTVTVYAHNSSLKVRTGQTVKRGQIISLCGSTGMSTGPHVHFEVRVGGKTVNPLGYI